MRPNRESNRLPKNTFWKRVFFFEPRNRGSRSRHEVSQGCLISHHSLTNKLAITDQRSLISYHLWDIPPIYGLAMCCDPELAIAGAIASQDHQPDGPDYPAIILIPAKLIGNSSS